MTKRFFFMLALIIFNFFFVKAKEDVDVYMQSLIEELQVLWTGVQTFDVFSKETFMLQAMCIWSVHDFLAFWLFARCVTKGHKGCPPRGPIT